jgi:hypothetical protein
MDQTAQISLCTLIGAQSGAIIWQQMTQERMGCLWMMALAAELAMVSQKPAVRTPVGTGLPAVERIADW